MGKVSAVRFPDQVDAAAVKIARRERRCVRSVVLVALVEAEVDAVLFHQRFKLPPDVFVPQDVDFAHARQTRGQVQELLGEVVTIAGPLGDEVSNRSVEQGGIVRVQWMIHRLESRPVPGIDELMNEIARAWPPVLFYGLTVKPIEL